MMRHRRFLVMEGLGGYGRRRGWRRRRWAEPHLPKARIDAGIGRMLPTRGTLCAAIAVTPAIPMPPHGGNFQFVSDCIESTYRRRRSESWEIPSLHGAARHGSCLGEEKPGVRVGGRTSWMRCEVIAV